MALAPGRLLTARELLRQLGEAGDLRRMVAPARPAALEHQRRDSDLPALVQRADEILFRHSHVFEEDFVEVTVAIEQNERPHRDPRCLHIDEKVADAVMLRRVGVGAHQ